MTPRTHLLPILMAFGLASCTDSGPPETRTGALGKGDIAAAETCSVDSPCSQGKECMFVDGEAICTDAASACALLDCPLEDCSILETYPAQVTCSSAPPLTACDPAVGCSDGLECMFLNLPGGDAGLYCADATACDLLECPDGESCVILETFPSQMTCAPDPEPEPQSCAVGAPCPEGLECMFVVDEPICTSADQACSAIGCDLEDCLILESYPAQVMCSP